MSFKSPTSLRAATGASITAALLMTALLPAQNATAADPSCAPLIAASMPKPEVPYRVNMTMVLDGTTQTSESVYINNVMYVRPPGENKWLRTVIKDMKAIAMMATDSLAGCSAGGVELVGKTPTRVWTTRSVNPFTKKPMKHKVWIGVADNRVYRQTVDEVDQLISYDNVVAPANVR